MFVKLFALGERLLNQIFLNEHFSTCLVLFITS